MGMVLGWLWFVIGYILMQSSANVWVALMLPKVVDRARQRIETRPVACFFIGLPVTLGLGIPALISFQIPQGFFLGFLALTPVFASSLLGGAAIAGILADRIQPLLKSESRIVSLTLGALGTTLCTLLPVVGWFMFLPVLGLMATGAGFLAWVSKREVAREAQPAPPPAPVAPPVQWSAYPQAPVTTQE
jgi:hypothetical protein